MTAFGRQAHDGRPIAVDSAAVLWQRRTGRPATHGSIRLGRHDRGLSIDQAVTRASLARRTHHLVQLVVRAKQACVGGPRWVLALAGGVTSRISLRSCNRWDREPRRFDTDVNVNEARHPGWRAQGGAE